MMNEATVWNNASALDGIRPGAQPGATWCRPGDTDLYSFPTNMSYFFDRYLLFTTKYFVAQKNNFDRF
jgi:hypothetical protein